MSRLGSYAENTIACGHVLDVLGELPDECVQMVATSPPFWSLRDYNVEPQVWGGEEGCQHVWHYKPRIVEQGDNKALDCSFQVDGGSPRQYAPEAFQKKDIGSAFCSLCEAWRGSLGLEPTPELYVQHLVEIFREVKRVLRSDGTLFLNLGSSYASGAIQHEQLCDIDGRVPEDCPMHDSIWNRPCDGCQAVSALRTFHNDNQPAPKPDAESHYPSPERMESLSVHPASYSSSVQSGPPLSSCAIADQPPSLTRAGVLPHDAPVSTKRESSQRLQTECSDLDSHACVQSECGSSSGGAQEYAHKDGHKPDSGETASSLAFRIEGKNHNVCPYLHSTTPYRKSQFKPKDLIPIPWMVAMALQADGWWLRNDIIWHKPNPMPESVRDRCTMSHEYVFLLTKSSRYFYDQEAVREPSSPTSAGNRNEFRGGGSYTDGNAFDNSAVCRNRTPGNDGAQSGRNKRTVWTIATHAFPGAHFATFSPKLIEPMILAGTSARGCCPECGGPWERVVEKTPYKPELVEVGVRQVDVSRGDKTRKLSGRNYNDQVQSRTLGWRPTCSHYDDDYRADFPKARSLRKRRQRDMSGNWWHRVRQQPGKGYWTVTNPIVLDLFMGAGTTALVALQHQRHFFGIELNQSYTKMAERRIREVQPRLI